jgi:hypothetical protein
MKAAEMLAAAGWQVRPPQDAATERVLAELADNQAA